MIIGYARVSTQEQEEKAQVEQLMNRGCERVYVDKESGTNYERPEFKLMRDILREGDVLVVTELSRVGRSLIHTLEFINYLKDNNINFISIRENIDINSPSGELILNIFASIADFERKRLLERQKVGIDYAKAHGVNFGRPSTDKDKVDMAIALYRTHQYSVKQICDKTGVSRAVFYRNLKKIKKITEISKKVN